MAYVFVTDFRDKCVVRRYDTQVELQKRLNEKTCTICGDVYNKTEVTLLEANVLVKNSSATLVICEHCIKEMYNTVKERDDE